jgi:nicotinate phosphoribosyltransferase
LAPPELLVNLTFNRMSSGTALLTDRYELTMLDAAVNDGRATTPASFEVFARRLPLGRRYGVMAGVARLVKALAEFRFGPDTLEWLRAEGIVAPVTLDWLAGYRFEGRIHAYADGEVFFPYSPVVTVEGTFGDAVVLETLILSVLNHDSAVASAASRMRIAAGDRRLIEMGGRRTHEEAAVAAALAAYIAGFDTTSNLAAGQRWGIPTAGTAAHASILVAANERAAFDAQLAAQGIGTTLLVDTYDIPEGITSAVEAAQAVGATGPGAIRIDSGDPADEIPAARALLDSLGATETRIVLSGDLDEYTIAALRDLPVDGFGVGTSVVTGSGAPTTGFVYKLVAVGDGSGGWRPVAKRSANKASLGGRKRSWRQLDDAGQAIRELVTPVGDDAPSGPVRSLNVCIWDDGPAPVASADEARLHHRSALGELHPSATDLLPGEPALRGDV